MVLDEHPGYGHTRFTRLYSAYAFITSQSVETWLFGRVLASDISEKTLYIYSCMWTCHVHMLQVWKYMDSDADLRKWMAKNNPPSLSNALPKQWSSRPFGHVVVIRMFKRMPLSHWQLFFLIVGHFTWSHWLYNSVFIAVFVVGNYNASNLMLVGEVMKHRPQRRKIMNQELIRRACQRTRSIPLYFKNTVVYRGWYWNKSVKMTVIFVGAPFCLVCVRSIGLSTQKSEFYFLY